MCPFAFSAEPVRRRLRWHYGEQLTWQTRMIVLTLEPGEAERLAEGAPNLQRRFDHKLGGPKGQRRYTAPSYEIVRSDQPSTAAAVPGFNPVEAYEVTIANLAPELVRRPRPDSVEDLLAWAGEPPATAEIAAVTQLGSAEARAALSRVARPIPAGADLYWTLDDADMTAADARPDLP